MDVEQQEIQLDEFYELDITKRFSYVHKVLTEQVAKLVSIPKMLDLKSLKPLYLEANPDEVDYFDEDVFAHSYENPGLNEILTLLLPGKKAKFQMDWLEGSEDKSQVYLEIWQEMVAMADLGIAADSIKAHYDEEDDVVISFVYNNKDVEYSYEADNEHLDHEVFEDFNDFASRFNLASYFITDLVDEYFVAAYLVPEKSKAQLEKYSPFPGY